MVLGLLPARRRAPLGALRSPLRARDEGEAYGARLRAAGVAVTTVRYDGITHDFMMLNPLSDTHAARAAIAQAVDTLRRALHSGP